MLKTVLANLLCAAKKSPGNIQSITLRNGLEIRLYVDRERQVHLALQRQKVFPAETEWLTVLRCWPVQLPEMWPQPVECSSETLKTKALCAVWQTPVLEF